MSIFEQASRLQLRYNTPKGLLTTEDLWNLPLSSTTGKANLDSIAIELDEYLSHQPKRSFVNQSKADVATAELQLKFDIVRHIIEVKMAENSARLAAAANQAQKQKIADLIAQKKDESLSNLSIEELEKLLKE